MNNIYYINIDPKLSIIKVEVTETINKLIIPNSKITKTGIYTKSNDELMYLDKISYLSIDYSKEILLDILKELDSTDIIYAMSINTKGIIGQLINAGLINQDVFSKYTGIDTDFIDSLIYEVGRLNASDFTILDYDGYFKSKITIHPFIDSKQLFFYGDMEDGIYYAYNYKDTAAKKSKDDDRIDIQKTKIVLGKKSSTNVYNVYKIPKQKEIDDLYKQFRDNCKGIDYYTIMLLNRVLAPKNIHYSRNNTLDFVDTPKRLEAPSNDILVSEILPAGVSYYAFQTFKELTDMLNSFINNDKLLYNEAIDITNMIYDDKGDIKEVNDFIVEYKYKARDNIYTIPVVTGLDLPTRNKLKAMSKSKPSVHLLILNVNNVYCRYYTIVKVNDDYVLTGNYPANMVLLEEK
jgi:hypothetical protein